MRTFEVIVLSAVVIITLFSLARVNQITDDNKENIMIHGREVADNSLRNRARSDIGLCIFSVSPTRRTPEYVKSCYDRIEKQSGIKVQRFGDGV